MKRILLLGGVVAAIVMIGLLAGGFWAIRHFLRPPPLSYAEMASLQEKGEEAAPEIPRLVQCLHWNDEDIRLQAALTLSTIGAKSVDPLREELNDADPRVRFAAAQALAFIGPDAAAAESDLAARIKDGDADVRRKAIYALGKVGVKSPQVVVSLIAALRDQDADVSATLIEVLDGVGAPPKESVSKLADEARTNFRDASRQCALKLLGRMGEPAVPTFGELLKDAPPSERPMVVHAIATLGPHAKPLLPELQTILLTTHLVKGDPEMTDRYQKDLMDTFKRCGADGAEGMTSVLKTLHDPKSPHHAPAEERSKLLLKALGEMGNQAKGAVPLLIVLLDEDKALRPEILDALGGIGPAARAAIPSVQALAKNPELAESARTALRRMGVIEKAASP